MTVGLASVVSMAGGGAGGVGLPAGGNKRSLG